MKGNGDIVFETDSMLGILLNSLVWKLVELGPVTSSVSPGCEPGPYIVYVVSPGYTAKALKRIE